MFYVPNLPYIFFLAAKARSTVFFSVANPAIKSSGNGSESKFETLQLIPDEWKPKDVLHKKNEDLEKTIEKIRTKEIHYPVIAKPDIGFRGLLVKKINSEIELKNYLKNYDIDFIIQEFIEFKNECGIFYSRIPTESKGTITSITIKKYPTIIGDGQSTFEKLVISNKRSKLYKELIFENHAEKLNIIPNKKEEILLSTIGNHCKGTQFVNGNHLISEKLINTFDKINAKIPGWFYGRVDLKYANFHELEEGKNFKIIEINGIISEPTHIYDVEKNSYFEALRNIRKHWGILYKICKTNHNVYKIPYKNTFTFWKEIIDLKAYSKKIEKLTK